MDRKTVKLALKSFRSIESEVKQKLAFFHETGEEQYREQAEQLRIVKKEIVFQLNRLPQDRRSAVWSHYVKGDSWVRVSIKYGYSERQLRNIANDGLDRLAKDFSSVKLLTDFCASLTS